MERKKRNPPSYGFDGGRGLGPARARARSRSRRPLLRGILSEPGDLDGSDGRLGSGGGGGTAAGGASLSAGSAAAGPALTASDFGLTSPAGASPYRALICSSHTSLLKPM